MINFENIDPETVKILVFCEDKHLLTGKVKDYNLEVNDKEFANDGKTVKYNATFRRKLTLFDLQYIDRELTIDAITGGKLIHLDVTVNDINVMSVEDKSNMTGYLTMVSDNTAEIFLRFDPKSFTHLY